VLERRPRHFLHNPLSVFSPHFCPSFQLLSTISRHFVGRAQVSIADPPFYVLIPAGDPLGPAAPPDQFIHKQLLPVPSRSPFQLILRSTLRASSRHMTLGSLLPFVPRRPIAEDSTEASPEYLL